LETGFNALEQMAIERGFSSLKEALSTQLRDFPHPRLEGTNEVVLVNPKAVFYCAEYGRNGEAKTLNIVAARSSLFSVRLGWPPVYSTPATEERVTLPDGTYALMFDKGISLSDLGELGKRDLGSFSANGLYVAARGVKLWFKLPISITNNDIEWVVERFVLNGSAKLGGWDRLRQEFLSGRGLWEKSSAFFN